MTLYAPAEIREFWRINYGILKLESTRDAHDFWERRGWVFPGSVLALAHAIEQIDTDEELMRQALEALEQTGLDDTYRSYEFEHAVRAARRERLK